MRNCALASLIAISRREGYGTRIRKSVGIIGLGIIGRRIADHLRRQGLSVFVWNRTPKPVPNFVGSPWVLAQTCNYLQVFVSDDDALMRMIQTISMALTPRHIVIAHPTVSPETMREAAGLVERRGARLVEAPFTGSKLGAEKGRVSSITSVVTKPRLKKSGRYSRPAARRL